MENITVKELVSACGGTLVQGNPEAEVDNVSIDSRTMRGNDLFVPLIGEKVDAHRFIDKAVENGAVAVLCSEKEVKPAEGAAWIKVQDTLKALQDIGMYYKKKLNIPVVAVTGSVGKTTTREMTATALSAGFRVFKTSKNFNSNIGVPATMTEIKESDEMAVLELGMSDFGEMEEIARMAEPQTAVITNIGVAHIGQLGSRENICREKLSVTKGMMPGGILVLNGDDDLLSKVDESIGFKRIFYGLGPNCDVRGEDIRYEEGKTLFTAVFPDKKIQVELPVTGQHMVMNALAALTVADIYRIPLEKAAGKLKKFGGFKNRQQIYGVKNFRVIDDTYNASPDSMRAALQVLEATSCQGRKTAVLADMLELGPDSPVFHYEIGRFAGGRKIDRLITIGEMAVRIAEGCKNAGKENGWSGDKTVISFSDNAHAIDYLKKTAESGELILFKGSNGMRLNEVIEALKEGE